MAKNNNQKAGFYESEAGTQARQLLQSMVSDDKFHTSSSYSANSERYPNNRMPFVDKHLEYLRSHPGTDPRLYISNLRLMTRKK